MPLAGLISCSILRMGVDNSAQFWRWLLIALFWFCSECSASFAHFNVILIIFVVKL